MAVSSKTNQAYTITLALQGVQAVEAALKQVEQALNHLTGSTQNSGAAHKQAAQASHDHETALHKLGEAAERVTEPFKKLTEHVREFGSEFVKGMGLGAGLFAAEKLGEGLKEFTVGIVEAASAGEQFTTQMQNFYGSTQAAGQVLEWTNQQAAKMPFSLDAIRTATANLSATGQDVGALLPALGNIATAMHTTLPDAVNAFNKAVTTGSLRGLASQLHLSKQTLLDFGVQVDSSGKIITSTLAPALEKLANSRFGDAMKNQGNTLQGVMTIISNSFEIFKEKAGEGLFDALKGKFGGFLDYIQSHQGVIEKFATAFGTAMGNILAGAIKVGSWIVTTFGPWIVGTVEVIIGAWNKAAPYIQMVIEFIQGVFKTFGDFLHDKVLPVVLQVIGQMNKWWNQHYDEIKKVLSTIWKAIQDFWKALGPAINDGLKIIKGIWDIGWGAISGVVGTALDVITGNWKQFAKDIDTMAKTIAKGILGVMEGMVDGLIDLFAKIPNPMEKVLKFLDNPTVLAFLKINQPALASFVQAASDASQAARGGAQAAKNAVHTWTQQQKDAIDAKPNMITGEYSYDSTVSDQQAGANWLKSVRALLKSLGKGGALSLKNLFGIDLNALLSGGVGSAGATGLPPVLPGLGTGGGTGTAADPNQVLRDAYEKATKHLQADLARGVPEGVLMADRENIRKVMLLEQKKGLVTVDDIFMEMNSSLTSIHDAVHQKAQAVLDQATQTLNYEEILKLPHKVLLAQVNQIMKDYAAATGNKPGSLAYRATRQQYLDQINGGADASQRPAEPNYGVYGSIRGGAGYGSVVATFGSAAHDPNQAIIAALREQLVYYKTKYAQDEKIIGHLRGTENNTRAAAVSLAHIHFPIFPASTVRNSNASVRSSGAFSHPGR